MKRSSGSVFGVFTSFFESFIIHGMSNVPSVTPTSILIIEFTTFQPVVVLTFGTNPRPIIIVTVLRQEACVILYRIDIEGTKGHLSVLIVVFLSSKKSSNAKGFSDRTGRGN